MSWFEATIRCAACRREVIRDVESHEEAVEAWREHVETHHRSNQLPEMVA